MSDLTQTSSDQVELADYLGRPSLLPGECPDEYEQELQSLLDQAAASSPLCIFLIEQIYETMRWIRRHTADKRSLIINSMAAKLVNEDEDTLFNKSLMYCYLEESSPSSIRPELAEALELRGETISSLRSKAMRFVHQDMRNIDRLVEQHLNTLRHLQKSLEQHEMKPRILARLDLQIENMRRDLEAIPHGE